MVECNLDVLDIKKMTFKKDDKTILSLYLQDKNGAIRVFRVQLEEATDFCQDVQVMIGDYSE